jgi:dTDP-4-amino-4,6-dideoxygalactose transaminase
MKSCNVEVRPIFYDIHEHIHLKGIKNINNITEVNEIINSSCILPSFPELNETQIGYITKCLSTFLE